MNVAPVLQLGRLCNVLAASEAKDSNFKGLLKSAASATSADSLRQLETRFKMLRVPGRQH